MRCKACQDNNQSIQAHMIKVRNVDIKDGRRHINHVFSTKEKAADMENFYKDSSRSWRMWNTRSKSFVPRPRAKMIQISKNQIKSSKNLLNKLDGLDVWNFCVNILSVALLSYYFLRIMLRCLSVRHCIHLLCVCFPINGVIVRKFVSVATRVRKQRTKYC